MKRLSYWLLLLLLAAACKKSTDTPAPPLQSTLVSDSLIATVSQNEVEERSPSVPGLSLLIRYGVKAYKITYSTQLPDGSAITASGLVLMPDGFKGKLTILGFQHATITSQGEAPSAYQPVGNMEAYVIGTLVASLGKGYMVVMPDYIGYGTSSNVPHPYQHRASLARTSLDMLRAARGFAAQNNLGLNKSIRLAGYSEGGFATMSLHKMIDEQAADEFTVSNSYPGGGAYDALAAAKAILSMNTALTDVAVSDYIWVILTYNDIYGINRPLSDIFTAGNAETIQAAIVSGDLSGAAVSHNPAQLFQPAFISGIEQETDAGFIAAFKDNDVHSWKPSGQVTIYHATNDEIVPLSNAQATYSAMQAAGASVSFVPLQNADHEEGAIQYAEAVLQKLIQ